MILKLHFLSLIPSRFFFSVSSFPWPRLLSNRADIFLLHSFFFFVLAAAWDSSFYPFFPPPLFPPPVQRSFLPLFVLFVVSWSLAFSSPLCFASRVPAQAVDSTLFGGPLTFVSFSLKNFLTSPQMCVFALSI